MTHVDKSPRMKLRLNLMLLAPMVIVMAMSAQAQIPDLIITVGDTVGQSGQQNSVITVFMDNVFDTVAGFELWLQLDRPDIMEFQTNIDTLVDTTYWMCLNGTFPNCLDSAAVPADSTWDWFNVDTTIATVGSVDTTGTLISGWEFMASRSVTGTPYDIKVTAQANLLSVPGFTTGVPPQQGGVLFRLLGDVLQIPDTLSDRTVRIIPQPFLEHFSFSRPDGTSIGINTIFVPDTNCFQCQTWAPPPDDTLCLDWLQVPCNDPGGVDSTDIGLDTVAVLDTTAVKLFAGSLTVPAGICGDLNCDPAHEVDIADLTTLIDHLFISFSPLCTGDQFANINCDPNGEIDIADLTTMIDHLFISFSPLCCQ